MPDPESSTPLETAGFEEKYPIQDSRATPSLLELIRERIEKEGPLAFPDFMEMALYHPHLGYYARETRQVGRAGDFFTSVSVGPLFGKLLARRFLSWWQEAGAPARWRIIECGAHDGTLAADVLEELFALDAAAFSALKYLIQEPLPRLEAAQRQKLAVFQQKVGWILGADALEPLPGIVFGNELLDALPFHVVEWRDGKWLECRVALSPEGLIWEIGGDFVGKMPEGSFPEGYRTEVRTNFKSFLEPLAGCLQRGLMIWPDYGFAAEDYYHPDRTQGTLRTFSKHRAGEDPLAAPGEVDITAHVDFTAVADAAQELEGRPTVFRNQGGWLTEIAREWLLSQEGKPDLTLLRQFQTLMHPAHLGGKFQILELEWGGMDGGKRNLRELGL